MEGDCNDDNDNNFNNDIGQQQEQQQEQHYWIICVAHGDVLQILQTAFNKNMNPSQHRSIQHLETATLRPLNIKQ